MRMRRLCSSFVISSLERRGDEFDLKPSDRALLFLHLPWWLRSGQSDLVRSNISELDDEADDDDDETAEGAKGSSPKGEGDDAAALAAAGGDQEIAQTLELFDKTRKLRKSDVHAMLAAAAALDDKIVNDEPATPPEAPEVQIFEDRETGAWDVKDVLDESQALDEKDLENA